MRCQVVGISRRQSTNKQTGQVSVWSSLYCLRPFSDYDIERGAQGYMASTVNTRKDTTHIHVNDQISINYEPTGFRDKNGSPEYSVASIDVINEKK